jgi:oxygen-independent coproporphyrinogen-3 oxidase
MHRFVDRILDEARLWVALNRAEVRPTTLFFGGGTPSLLPREAMGRLLAGLASTFDFSDVDEWTVEVNPATADLDDLCLMRSLGVTRLSMGAQSFEPDELKMLERHHDPADVPAGVELARRAGFDRINLDLIYAIPGQTIDSWNRSLDAALGTGVDHLSCYALTYEEPTPLAVKKRLGVIRAADESVELALMRHTRTKLSDAGLPAYEISNHARPSQACRHNLAYWTGLNYLGLGPSAASHLEGVRFKNLPHLRAWEESIEQGAFPAVDVETLSRRERLRERIMIGLRLAEGVDLMAISRDLGEPVDESIDKTASHLVSIGMIRRTADRITLTDRGVELADAVCAEFAA